MYVLTVGGHFEGLLDMSFADAERYAMRRITACGYKPCYRWLHSIRDIPHSIEYGLLNDWDDSAQISQARLEQVRPKTTLLGEGSWDYVEERDKFSVWEQFIKEALEDGGDYYQWPPLEMEEEEEQS